jgi:hypothetical protein
VARESGLLSALTKIQEARFAGQQVTLRGELIGPGVQVCVLACVPGFVECWSSIARIVW